MSEQKLLEIIAEAKADTRRECEEGRIVVDQEQKRTIKDLRHKIISLQKAHQKEMEAVMKKVIKIVNEPDMNTHTYFVLSSKLEAIAQKHGINIK